MIHAPVAVNTAGGAILPLYQNGGAGGDDGGDDPNYRRVGRGHEVDAPPVIPDPDEDEDEDDEQPSAMQREQNQRMGRGGRRPYHRYRPPAEAPLVTEPCAVCGQRFWSVKALHGHYRVHSDRGWRGVLPPWRRPQIRKPNREREVAKSLIILAGGPEGEQPPEFKCACGRIFDSRQALGGHRASHKSVQGCFAREVKDTGKQIVVVEGEAPKKRRGRPKNLIFSGESSPLVGLTGESSKRKRVMLDLNLPVQPEEDEDDNEDGKGFDLNIPQDENDNESSSTPAPK